MTVEERALVALVEKQDREIDYLKGEIERLASGWPDLYRALFPKAVDSSWASFGVAIAAIRWLRQQAALPVGENSGQLNGD
jgi:hypothetical protein